MQIPRTKNLPAVDDVAFLPPHEPTPIAGLHAYSHRVSVAPGEELDLRIAGDGPARIEILRHRDHTSRAEVIARLGRFRAEPRAIHRGSYVHVGKPVQPAGAFSAEVWFRQLAAGTPGTPGASQGIMSHAAFGLWLEGSQVNFAVRTGDGEKTGAGPELKVQHWHHAVVRYDGKSAALFIDGRKVRSKPCIGVPHSAAQPLRLGAMGNLKNQAVRFWLGDLCAPSIYDRALTDVEIKARFRAKALDPARGCVGHWKFDALNGNQPFRDITPNARHGRGVNYPARLVPGPRRTIDHDWCTYDPTRDRAFGHAVRLMPDGVVDCRWPVTAAWRVPKGLRSGQYAARVIGENGQARLVHFIVKPPRRPAASRGDKSRGGTTLRARVACLSTTNTRVAYNFQPFANPALDYGAYQPHPSYPILGQLLGLRRPATGEPWETTTVNFELPFYEWLNRHGIPHDVYSEWDLEADPNLLDGYGVVAWAGHSEYWSAQQWEAIARHQRRGGHVLAMSGNTAFWRVSVDLKNSVVEVRKHDRHAMPGVTADPMIHSAHHHQMDHLPGSYMHRSGWPQPSLGLGFTCGFMDPPLDGPRAGYAVLVPGHEVFHSPRKIKTSGVFAYLAAGYETDMSAASMVERFGRPRIPHYPARDGSPHPMHARPTDRPTVLARAKAGPAGLFDYDANYFHDPRNGRIMWSEMLYQERRNGAISFAVGSVLAGEILLTDENFSNFLRNVLDRMR